MAELAESDAVPTPPESHAPPGHASASCPNCRTATPDAFCSHCGQRNLDLRLSLRELISEAAEEALGVDSRIVNTLRPFFLRPGRGFGQASIRPAPFRPRGQDEAFLREGI